MKLSIIIVNYKSRESISKCLDSVFEKIGDEVDWEMIVVNNDDGDSLKGLERKQKMKVVNLYRNAGFGPAANKGSKEAQGELLFFLNPDAEIMSSRINSIFNEFDKDPRLGIIGPKIVNKDGTVEQWSAGKEINLPNLMLNNLGFSRSRKIWESQIKVETDWVSGAALFVRKGFFLKRGGFDEKFFLYFEDMDLCKRAKKHGFSVLYFPDFFIKHEGGRSFENKKIQKCHYYDSMEKYFLKYHGKWQSAIIRLIIRIFQK
jgi:GT2 family glycosyltransferase